MWYFLQGLDLRFQNPEEEREFTRSKEKPALGFLAFCSGIVFFRQIALFLDQMSSLRVSSAGEDHSILLAPRIWFVCVYSTCIGGSLLCASATVMKLARGNFHFLHHEVMWVFWMTFHLICLCLERPWNAARILHKLQNRAQPLTELSEGKEVGILLVLILVPFMISLGAPLRQHLQIWFTVSVPVLYCIMNGLFGSPNPSVMPSVLITLCQFTIAATFCSWRYERFERREWRQQKELSRTTAVSAGMTAIAHRLCDFVFRLSEDLRVSEDLDAHAWFLGHRARGLLFSDILVESDRVRYREMLQRASASLIPQCMPITVLHPTGPQEAELLAVDTGLQDPRYIIGMKIDIALGANGIFNPLCSADTTAPASAEAMDDCRESSHSSARTRPETTFTGRVFQEASLEQIAVLGKTEHWCVASPDLELTLPCRVLGSGSFGVVVAANFHGKLVAVKVPKMRHDAGSLRYLVNELRILRHLRHKNLVLFHGAVVDPSTGTLAIVYEFVNGMTLECHVRQRQAPAGERDCFCIVSDVCSALRYLHAQEPPIVHADIKSGNVMVEATASGPRAKLIDFGLSRLMSRGVTRVGGTLAWRAPELFAPGCDGLPGPAADVFSFGWIVYFTVTGLEPHDGLRDEALALAVQGMLAKNTVEPLTWPPDISFRKESQELCRCCFEFLPRLRPKMVIVDGMVSGWLTVERACKLSFELAHVVMPKVPWHAGIQQLLAETLPAKVAEPLPSLEDPMGGLPDVDQVDVYMAPSLTIRGAWGSGNQVRPGLRGTGLGAYLQTPDAMRTWLCSITNDVFSGGAAAPLVVQAGRVGFRAGKTRPNGDPKGATAMLLAFFPAPAAGMTPDNYVVSLRLRDWRLVCDWSL